MLLDELLSRVQPLPSKKVFVEVPKLFQLLYRAKTGISLSREQYRIIDAETETDQVICIFFNVRLIKTVSECVAAPAIQDGFCQTGNSIVSLYIANRNEISIAFSNKKETPTTLDIRTSRRQSKTESGTAYFEIFKSQEQIMSSRMINSN